MQNHKYIIDGHEYNVPENEVDVMILEMVKFQKECSEMYSQNAKNTNLMAFSITVFIHNYIKEHFQKYMINEEV